jgi:hypothetical protein
VAELAVHFVQGRDPYRVLQYLQYASENALQRSAHQEVVPHLTQGLALLQELAAHAVLVHNHDNVRFGAWPLYQLL